MKIPKIEYEIYYPFDSNNFTKLNLTYCKDYKIYISIPYQLNDNIDKYNISSNYYNDICSITTSKSGTDISLKDRKNEFIEDNMTLCEENCDLINYNYKIEKVKCSCEIKINLPLIDEIKFDKEKLKNSFIDINNILNIKILKCYLNVFRINNLKNNLGFCIIIFIILLFFVCFFVFLFKSKNLINKEIKDIISAKKIESKI